MLRGTRYPIATQHPEQKPDPPSAIPISGRSAVQLLQPLTSPRERETRKNEKLRSSSSGAAHFCARGVVSTLAPAAPAGKNVIRCTSCSTLITLCTPLGYSLGSNTADNIKVRFGAPPGRPDPQSPVASPSTALPHHLFASFARRPEGADGLFFPPPPSQSASDPISTTATIYKSTSNHRRA